MTASYRGFSSSATIVVKEPVVTSLAVSPATAIIKVGETVSFIATATFEDGSTKPVTGEAGWSPGSAFTGIQAGQFTIAANIQGFSANAVVTVRDKEVTGLSVSPAQKTIKINESVGFSATAIYEDGRRHPRGCSWNCAVGRSSAADSKRLAVGGLLGTGQRGRLCHRLEHRLVS